MVKRQYRFKQAFFQVDGIHNIPAHVICAGNYDLRSYCCKKCGEIYVADYENPARQNILVNELVKDQVCQSCNSYLEDTLVKYPENIFYNGAIHRNNSEIDYRSFEETYLKDIFAI